MVDRYLDLTYLKEKRRLLQFSPKNINLLILIGSERPFFVDEIVSFLNKIRIKPMPTVCDTGQGFASVGKIRKIMRHPSNTNFRKYSNLKFMEENKLKNHYDYIISFMGLEILDRIDIKGDLILITNNFDCHYLNNTPKLRYLNKYKNKTITVYNLFKNTLPDDYYCKLGAVLDVKYSINWPPHINTNFDARKFDKEFNYVFLGGRDRDYKTLYEYKDVFKGKRVIITRGNERNNPSQQEYIEQLKQNKNFVFLDNLSNIRYSLLLLKTKIAFIFLEEPFLTDSTAISDAMWYGIPVISNKVRANDFLSSIIFLVDSKVAVENCLSILEDVTSYNKISEKIRSFSRENNNLFNLMVKLYSNIAEKSAKATTSKIP